LRLITKPQSQLEIQMKNNSLILALLLAGCATAGSEVRNPDPKHVDEMRATAKSLATQLGAKLKAEMAAGSPESAIAVCKTMAPQIATELSAHTGWKVGRVGTRARNSESGTPDAWNAKALEQFSARMKQGEKPDAMELSEVVTAPSGQATLRYAKAIAMQPMCLACHGATDGLSEGVKARLRTEYPMDKATGYGEGELRGAIVISRPL
jgi:hypothetical protein